MRLWNVRSVRRGSDQTLRSISHEWTRHTRENHLQIITSMLPRVWRRDQVSFRSKRQDSLDVSCSMKLKKKRLQTFVRQNISQVKPWNKSVYKKRKNNKSQGKRHTEATAAHSTIRVKLSTFRDVCGTEENTRNIFFQRENHKRQL